MKVEKNKVVSIHYEVKDNSTNEQLDGNIGSKPLEFICGKGQVIKGLEDSIAGLTSGENRNFIVTPEDGYGAYNSEFVQNVPKEQFSGIELEIGMTLYGQSEDGSTIPVVVKNIDKESVEIDYNHPLAGKELAFYVDVLSVRDATEDEITSGIVNCQDNKGGGCCGGGCGTH